MKDIDFINETIIKGRNALQKAETLFSGITIQQLNWQPSPVSWSIAQCLDHLIRSHSVYFNCFEKIVSDKYKMSFWEKYSPFTKLTGRLMKDQMQENVKRKLVAPKKIQPISAATIDIVNDYRSSINKFLEYIYDCRGIDLDKTVISSPIIKIVTYSLRDAFQFLVTHEHRHINQAMRIKLNEEFPQ